MHWKLWKRAILCSYLSIGPMELFTQAEWNKRSIFKRILTGWNSKFSFWTGCYTNIKEPNVGGRKFGFIPFPKVLVLCEMQTASFRVGTHVTMFIFYDCKHYTRSTTYIHIRGSLNKFPDFFHKGTFIDSIHMKL